MARSLFRFLTPLAAAAILTASSAAAQPGVTLPPDGNNEFGSVTQGIGLVRVTIQYNSPHVHSPAGEDRHGKIWGGLVPYGMANLGFGTCGDQCPWRGGANENTVFTTSHDVKVQGQPLPAGSYGVHFIPGPEEWTIVFSKNHTSWGSFFYDAKEDALRVKAKPEKSEYHEWLTYEFTERKPDHATAALKWEDLQLPFTIAVDDIASVYIDNLRQELRSSPGFSWQNWTAAARYCLENKKNLEEAMVWADNGGPPARYRPGELHDPGDPLRAPGRERQGRGRAEDHGPGAQPPRHDPAGDPPVRPLSPGPEEERGGPEGLPAQRQAVPQRLAGAPGPRPRPRRPGPQERGARGGPPRAEAGARREQPQERRGADPADRGGTGVLGPRHGIRRQGRSRRDDRSRSTITILRLRREVSYALDTRWP